MRRPWNYRDLTGRRFGKLTVVGPAHCDGSARLKNISSFTVYDRIRRGWDPVLAVTTPTKLESVPLGTLE